MKIKFSWLRLWAMIIKEFIQMKRDTATFGMIVMIPLIQVIIFGYAINSDPKHLTTALLVHDNSQFTRIFIKGMENTNYFDFTYFPKTEREAGELLAEGKIQFVLNIPTDFTRELIRNHHPTILLEADATDPAATSKAIAAIEDLPRTVFNRQFRGELSYLRTMPPAVNVEVQAKYNPAGITQYNIVPGLLGVVLTMTMTMITAIAITRERERGTMENLLATPIQPLEVILGKIIPYVFVGYIQITLILLFARFLFAVPMLGSLALLYGLALPFIAANLAVGLTISTLTKNQLQAVQMTTFFFLPSILLSGFMFPFAGMPIWAQRIAEVLPLTYFLRIVRGILLKGNGWFELWPNVWPIFMFLIAVVILAVMRYQRTLD